MENPAKFHNFILVILFIMIITVPVFNSFTGIWEYERKDENRIFKDSISIDINRLDVFPGEFDEFLKDNFSFRSPLLDIYHHIKFYYFKVSPHPDRTIVGLNNWFFMAGKEKDIIEGKLNYSEEQLEMFSAEWKSRKNYFDSKGIKFYWIIGPFKHNIYPEFLPFNIDIGETKRVDQLKDYFKGELEDVIIDPSPDFFTAKENVKLYYQLDNHWNLSAGHLVSKLLMSKIQMDFPDLALRNIPDHNWKDSIISKGIHYNIIGIESLLEKERYPDIELGHFAEAEKFGFIPPEGFGYPDEYEMRYLNANATSDLRILVIRDSFGRMLMPFIIEQFKESVFIFDAWRYATNEEIVEAVKPDIVVFIGLETHMGSIIGAQ